MSKSRQQLLEYVMKQGQIGTENGVFAVNCEMAVYLMDNCEITIDPRNRFFASVNCAEIMQDLIFQRVQKYEYLFPENDLHNGDAVRAYMGGYDYGHTSAEWESVISLGIYGLRKRIEAYAAKCPEDQKKQAFYQGVGAVYNGALRFMKRVAEKARACGKEEMAMSLIRLTEHKPESLYEAMQTSLIYFTLQHIFDGTCLRTLGRLDSLFYPFYQKENPETANVLIEDFMAEIDRIPVAANVPFAIGGTDISGNSLVNDLSYRLLDTYRKLPTVNTKLHLLVADSTPREIVKQALDAVREGNNSICFMSDKRIIESLVKLGQDPADAANYHVVGCYECGGNGEITCSCNAKVNIPKALELALNDGVDVLTGLRVGLPVTAPIESYEDLYREFKRQLIFLCNCAMKRTDLIEAHNSDLHAAPVLSGTYTSALENGGDIYCDNAAKYCNSSVNAVGLATATDSLAAIRRLVYEEKTHTLAEFTEILRSNWENQEALRLRIKHKFPKFGNADEKTDAIAANIVDTLADSISGRPNQKGGKYRLGLFSIDWRWELGKKMGASADGRRRGEPLSQNTGATFGADRQGTTAHLLSVSRLDTSHTPNCAIVDVDFHTSAVKGENGLNSMVSTLLTYFSLGGFAVHYNVLDTDVLEEACRNPEKYPNLQVRLCGWNVLFHTLSDREQKEFIERSKQR